MAWRDTLLDASFRGITFDVISSPLDVQRALSEHAYPFVHGADIEDLGNDARALSLEIILFGDEYESQLSALTAAFDVFGAGELVHPIFGTIQAQVVSYKIDHDAENIDQCRISVQFKQHTPAAGLFEKTLPAQTCESIGASISVASEAATNALSKEVAAVNATGIFSRIEQLRNNMTIALHQLEGKVAGVISSGLDAVNFPTAWAADVSAVVNGIVDLRGFDVTNLSAQWKATFTDLSDPITYPPQTANTARSPVRDLAVVNNHIQLSQALGKADAARLVLLSEIDTPSLSLAGIELLAADCRTSLESVMDQTRVIYGIESSRPIVESLKNVALGVQDAAKVVINARPPLVKKTVEGLVNYRLQAHFWYADHTRAPELARLNLGLRSPNLINKGVVLNAYAS